VVRLLDDGVVVDLGDDVEGFVPRSHVAVPAGKDVADVLEPGQPIGVRVIETDAANRRIVLTVTQMPEPPVKRAEPPAPEGEEEQEETEASEAAESAEPAEMEAPTSES
jgi:small subunit ribosomal protein S1